MSGFINKSDDAHKMVHIKSERMHLNEMSLFNIVQGEQNYHLMMLNKLIQTSANDTERVQYYLERAKILFSMNKWNDVLIDIAFLEKNEALDDTLLTIKWKSTIYHDVAKIRNSMKNELGAKLFDNAEHVDLYINISEENINEVINKKHIRKNNTMSKRKRNE